MALVRKYQSNLHAHREHMLRIVGIYGACQFRYEQMAYLNVAACSAHESVQLQVTFMIMSTY